MRKIWLLILTVCLLGSCANDIDLFPDNVPSMYMVYGVLDVDDSLQQIKIRRTFAGEDAQRNLAENSDLFLPDPGIQVFVDEHSKTGSQRFEFNVNNYPKDNGYFANDRNPVHESFFKPVKGRYYDFTIIDPELDEPVTAQMKAIQTPLIAYPFNGDAAYNFADTLNPFFFKFSATGEVHLQQFFVNFIEIDNKGDTTYHHNRFDLRPRFKDSTYRVNYYSKSMTLTYLFNIIRSKIVDKPEVQKRLLHSFDYTVWAGDQVMSNYLRFAEKFSDNRKMYFSNIENGFGFFAASSHANIKNIYPTQPFYDTLIICPVTRDLKFLKYRYKGDFDRGIVQ